MKQLHLEFGLLAAVAVGPLGCSGTPDQDVGQSEVEQAISFPLPSTTATEETFTTFESGQVRPLAISRDGVFLYAVNTPDNRLEIFRVIGDHLLNIASVTVGLEPVAVAVRNQDEVWVVNHLSDSVSVVDVSQPFRARVVRTLLVGDEPRSSFSRKTAPMSRPPIAVRTRPEIRSSRLRRSAVPTSGSSIPMRWARRWPVRR